MHWYLILNGKNTDDDDVREAVEKIRDQGITLDVRVTWESGDAIRYVNEAIEAGADVIVAGGGDGTLSEVSTGLAQSNLDADNLPSVGLLPLGTANDFASAAQIPTEPDEALHLIRATQPVLMDLLKLSTETGEDWVANVASGGFGTQVTVETTKGLKKMLGGFAYLLTGVTKLTDIEAIPVRVRAENVDEQIEFIVLAIGNGKQAGGGHALCPDAVVNDGLLDITVIPELNNDMSAAFLTFITEGKNAAMESVAMRYRSQWVELTSDQPFYLNLDGEPVESTRFRIECIANRIRMHLPLSTPLIQRGSSS